MRFFLSHDELSVTFIPQNLNSANSEARPPITPASSEELGELGE